MRNKLFLMGMVLAVVTSPASAGEPWDTIINPSVRFKVVLNGAAVLDYETQTVWERAPSDRLLSWFQASGTCAEKTVGGRFGWRLPTIQELTSLIDSTQSPALPPGHPFKVTNHNYWSATSDATNSDFAWFVNFMLNDIGTNSKLSGLGPAWCVRGIHGVDPQ